MSKCYFQGSLEKEIVAAKKALMIFKTKSESLEMENTEWKVRAEGEKKRVADVGCPLCRLQVETDLCPSSVHNCSSRRRLLERKI